KLAHYYRNEKGADITFSKSVRFDMFEPEYDLVFASAIFSTSKRKIEQLRQYRPDAVVGGTAVSENPGDTVEAFLGIPADSRFVDYSIYPEFEYSIGMTQLGC